MNTLYPIFLKLENCPILIVGGGKIAAEKLQFILKNSPNAVITLVAKEVSDSVHAFNNVAYQLTILEKEFEASDIINVKLVIAATNDKSTNEYIYTKAKERDCLINVADTPALCDFYLGSIVTKGDLKIAISTNGKSPTLSKRLREFFEEVIPENMQDLILNLNTYRTQLKGNLEEKVNKLNELTARFLK